jgi:nucleoside-diphosphate-sugar epimerase
MRILLIGGSGFVGKNIYMRMKDKHTFTIMSRHKPDWLDLALWVQGDITKPDSLRSVLSKDYEVVVDLVGLVDQKSQYHYDVNVFGTRIITDALLLKKETKMVYISAINADKGGSEYLKTKREAERNTMLHANYLIIRPSILYGEEDQLTPQLLKSSSQFLPAFPKSKPLCPIYVGDLAVVFESLLDKTGSFNVCSKEMLTLGDMLNIIRKETKKKPVPQLPLALFKLGSPILEKLNIISSEQLSMLKHNYYREDTILYKYIEKPTEYEKFIQQYLAAAKNGSKDLIP